MLSEDLDYRNRFNLNPEDPDVVFSLSSHQETRGKTQNSCTSKSIHPPWSLPEDGNEELMMKFPSRTFFSEEYKNYSDSRVLWIFSLNYADVFWFPALICEWMMFSDRAEPSLLCSLLWIPLMDKKPVLLSNHIDRTRGNGMKLNWGRFRRISGKVLCPEGGWTLNRLSRKTAT